MRRWTGPIFSAWGAVLQQAAENRERRIQESVGWCDLAERI